MWASGGLVDLAINGPNVVGVGHRQSGPVVIEVPTRERFFAFFRTLRILATASMGPTRARRCDSHFERVKYP
jgi:hypothetical protein